MSFAGAAMTMAMLWVAAGDPVELTDLLAKGKLATDLGQYEEAASAFGAVADAAGASNALRAEALVRLGSAQQAAGDFKAALKSFDRAWQGPARNDADSLALLVQAVGGALPGRDRWAQIWEQVVLVADRSDPKRPVMTVVWPGVPRPSRRAYIGLPIILDFKEANLNDVFRLFADVTGFNVVVFPGVRGTVTIKVDHRPWDQALERVLTPHGLVYRVDGNVVLIGPPGQVGTAIPFGGRPIDVDLKDEDLSQTLADIARNGNETVVLDPAVSGRVTLKLNRVPWDQAFDVVARVNGLAWTRDGGVIRVAPRRNAKAL